MPPRAGPKTMTYEYRTEYISVEADFGQVFTAESKSGWEFVCFVPTLYNDRRFEILYRKPKKNDFREHI